MNHFLITRFNIRVDDWTTTRDGYQVNQTDWLEHRFRLFMDYCWPSVLNQSDQNFTWLVFFDTTTPEQFKALNENLVLKYPNFCPIYVDGIRSFLPSLRRELMERTNTDYLITSRIDNDDLIHRDFIKRVKEEAKPSGQLVIDMQRGYQLINKSKIFEVRNYIHYFNPFISLIESSSGARSVMDRNHRDWSTAEQVVAVTDKPYWIEHVHERNKLNAARNQLTLVRKTNWKEFGLDQPIRTYSLHKVLSSNLFIKLKRLIVKLKRLLGSKN